MTRLYLIEDHPDVRTVLRMLLGLQPGLLVCGEAAAGQAALEDAALGGADIALVDLSLPDMSGLDLIRILGERHPALRVAVLSGHADASQVAAAFAAGAQGYVLKGDATELPAALASLGRGERYLSPALGRPDEF